MKNLILIVIILFFISCNTIYFNKQYPLIISEVNILGNNPNINRSGNKYELKFKNTPDFYYYTDSLFTIGDTLVLQRKHR